MTIVLPYGNVHAVLDEHPGEDVVSHGIPRWLALCTRSPVWSLAACLRRWRPVTPCLLILLCATDADAQGQCPPTAGPHGACPLAVPRTLLQERDVDADGLPDNSGSTGGFCNGGAPACCCCEPPPICRPPGHEVGLDLFIPNPATQSVTCSIPGADVEVWIMSDNCNSCIEGGEGSVTLPAGTTNDQTLELVVSDFNGDICVCDGLLTCTFSTEAVCNDGADGDGDGLIDGADPNCCLDNDGDGFCGAADCDDANPIVHTTPGPVADLRVEQPSPDTELSWEVPVSDWVDVVSGSLSDLRGSGDFSLATCLIEDEANSRTVDTRPDPAPGDAYYYLGRGQNTCGSGRYGPPDLDSLAPCGYDPACPGCTFCDLQDPSPVCGVEQCQATFGFPPTICSGPTGRGGQGAICLSANDCSAGFACVPLALGGLECRRWCRSSSIDCPVGYSCVGFSPAVIIDGTEYGTCSCPVGCFLAG